MYKNSLFIFGGYNGQVFDARYKNILPLPRKLFKSLPEPKTMINCEPFTLQVVLNDFQEFRFEPVIIPRSTLMEDLRGLINNPSFADVKFMVEGQPVYAK